MKEIIIYTDGACQGNPGPGGWAVVLLHGEKQRELSGGAPATTNNRMELMAAIEALKALREPCKITLFSDSQYLLQGMESWIAQWKRRGWTTAAKQPVKNADLWRELDALTQAHVLTLKWVRGHTGDKWNERCDVLAVEEITKIRATHPPAQLEALRVEFCAKAEALAPSLPGF